jgi:Mg2+-importing ATPase
MTTKGAPEEIFKACSRYQDKTEIKVLTSKILLQIRQTYNDFSSQGFRILAIAAKPIKKRQEKYTATEETDMTFLGFMVFYDPPKTDVKETLVMMKDYGIAIKILTGDGPLITKKICADLGLEVKGIVTGEELDLNTMTDEEIFHRIAGATICARMSPSQKEKIILELKKHGATVGYLGDGINDAPSLKAADVGISVENAVDVARETADIIMLRKGLKELMDGVIEGRRTFGNTIKYLLMCLSSNFGNMFSMIGASIFLPFFPMTASQILLNNFLYDTSQLSIPSDNVDITYLKRPKHWDISFIKRYMVVFGLISSAFDFLTFYVLFGIFHLSGSVFQSGWFIESLATQILVVYIIRTQKIPFIQSKPSKYLVYTTLGILILSNIMILDGIGSWFGFDQLPLYALTAIAGLVIAYLIIVELTKHWFYKKWVIQ